ncbi:hypothetical protein SUGI_0219200 [Cryptomeria japonica]|nr:hypothetical protein SUGI_0219200 [Cryptomeria japonica]
MLKMLSNGFMLVECPSRRTKKKTINVCSYMMGGYGFYLKNWEVNFNPLKEEIYVVLVWIKLYNFPIEYWVEETLKLIGDKLGTFERWVNQLNGEIIACMQECVKLEPLPPFLEEIEIRLEMRVSVETKA